MSSGIRIQRICEHCAGTFEAKTTVTRFCSDYCAKRAYKLRQRQARIEASQAETRQTIRQPVAELQAKDFLSVEDVCDLFGGEPLNRVATVPGQAGEVSEDWPETIYPAHLH